MNRSARLLHADAVPLPFRVFTAEGESRQATTNAKLTARSRLSEIHRLWFEPVFLQRASESTKQLYRDTVAWWCRLTNDPQLAEIDDTTTAEFGTALTEATYRRASVGKEHFLSESSQAKHLRNLRTLLTRCGPSVPGNKPTRKLITSVPHVSVPNPDFDRKDPFSLEEIRAVGKVCPDLHRRWELSRYWEVDQWRAWLALLYYTGFRVSTIDKLEWEFIEKDRDNVWLNVPAKAVTKTSKAIRKAVHPQLAELLQHLPRSKASPFILKWPAHAKSRWTSHQRLQQIAGIDPQSLRGIHAWRRTHGTQLALMGSTFAIGIAQTALDHASSRTTEASYVSIEAVLVRQMPLLF